jgi:hypothetical protein
MFGIRDNNCFLACPSLSETVISNPQSEDLVMFQTSTSTTTVTRCRSPNAISTSKFPIMQELAFHPIKHDNIFGDREHAIEDQIPVAL